MPDDINNKIAPLVPGTGQRGVQKTGGAVKIKANANKPALHNRIDQANKAGLNDNELSNQALNRIATLLDCSGSMCGRKLELLKDAMVTFMGACNFVDTSVAINTFPHADGEGCVVPLSQNIPALTFSIHGLQAHGGTPMADSMRETLDTVSLTRGILVSDGEADNSTLCVQIARSYGNAEIPIDCVHIGESTGGESLLKEIAEITGGIYIKFDNVENFAKHFSYLTPQKRHLMLQGGVAGLIGAKEVKV